MSELQVIEKTLERAARRRRQERAFRGFWQGLLVGACLLLLALGIYKVTEIPAGVLIAAGAAVPAAGLIGLIIGGWRRSSVGETARWVDGRQNLQERLSTALELSKGSGSESWRELLVTDAALHIKDLDPRRLVQFRMPRTSRWALLALALSAGLGFVPEYRSAAHKQKLADQKVIKETGQQLVELTKRNLETRKPALKETEKSMEAVKELGERLEKQTLTRNEALKDIARITDRIKEEMKELGKEPALKRMEQAARSRNGENSPEFSQLQKQIEQAQKELGNNAATPEKMDKLNKDLSKLQEQARAAADKNGGMSQEDKQQLSQSMAALAKQAQEMGLQMPNLDQAIQALSASQTDMFLKDLEASSQDLEKLRDMQKSLEKMQAQMQQMGKDLAEQLQKGQAQAAQGTLQKMIKQLESANLSPEQLDKMMAEVSKALDPAGQYGDVKKFLSEAAGQMKSGQKAEAAQSLAEASKALDKLMEQMGDCNSLMAQLDALNKASMCVGTCQGWGMNPSNRPGLGKGGKPGSGVGTWASEDDGWGYNGQKTALWDNTGVDRPDMDARGITDRGPGELNEGLKPTQVKGQFSPGGQMPSITLKGVSISGTSSVKYEQAAAAAQSDAQSALSQEKVPRAYQSGVRDYFDDLKK